MEIPRLRLSSRKIRETWEQMISRVSSGRTRKEYKETCLTMDLTIVRMQFIFGFPRNVLASRRGF